MVDGSKVAVNHLFRLKDFTIRSRLLSPAIYRQINQIATTARLFSACKLW